MPDRGRSTRDAAESGAGRLAGDGGDAVGLAGCLRNVPDREADFAAFERPRKGRVEKLVEEARRNRDRKAPNNALTRGLRDLVLPFFLEMGIENARKAYSYTVDWDEKVAQGKLYRKV